MAMFVNDDRGTYSFIPGERPQPWSVLRSRIERYQEDPEPTVEEIVGWAPYRWAVSFGGPTIFVTGENRPTL
jgi:hypothetical protein